MTDLISTTLGGLTPYWVTASSSVVIATCLICSALVFHRHGYSPLAWQFTLTALLIGGLFLPRTLFDLGNSQLLSTVALASLLLATVAMAHLRKCLLGSHAIQRWRPVTLWCVALLLVGTTPYLVTSAATHPWGMDLQLEPAATVLVGFVVLMLLLGVVDGRKLRLQHPSSSITGKRLRYLHWAQAALVLAAFDLISAFGFNIPPVGWLGFCGYLLINTAMIFKHHNPQLSSTDLSSRLVANLSQPMLVLDLEGNIKEGNPAVNTLLGLENNSLAQQAVCDVLGLSSWPPVWLWDEASRQHSEQRTSVKLKHKSFTELKITHTQLRSANNNPIGYLWLLDQTNPEMADLGHTRDALTGLANRTLFIEHLDHAIAAVKRNQNRRIALLYVDLDRFKLINDSLDHAAGDRLLLEVSRQLVDTVRSDDIVARLGSDEFAVLSGDLGDEPDAALRLAERIRRRFSLQTIDVFGHKVHASLSIGVVPVDNSYREGTELLRDADTAVHAAKRQGGSTSQMFHSQMRRQVVQRLNLETELRDDLKLGRFPVYYQPIIELANDRIAGFEALMRWQHRERGLLTPAVFLEAAEETGLIVNLGHKIREQVAATAAEWAQTCDPERWSICLNVSEREFLQPDFVSRLHAQWEANNLPLSNCKIELTERITSTQNKICASHLEALRELGIRTLIDDFGTGYSCLSRLRSLPVDSLKIDRSFIHNMVDSSRDSQMVKTIISLAHNMGQEVVAEGVETEQQLDLLRDMGCDYVQGFFTGTPSPASAALRTLRASNRPNLDIAISA